MKPKDFVNGIYEAVIDENIQIYKDLFYNTSVEQASDFYWKNALKLFGELSEEQQKVLFLIIRQVMVDTTSNILGILDGVSGLGGLDNNFHVYSGDSKEILNGDLQSFFLEKEENL